MLEIIVGTLALFGAIGGLYLMCMSAIKSLDKRNFGWRVKR